MIITCPSGFAGEIRGLKVKELQRLADPSLARGGRHIDVMLGVMHAITDPGPYRWAAGEMPVWDQVLSGDRFAALIDVRMATWGPEYAFTGRCEECREPYEWEIDLRDLPRKDYPASTVEQLREGGRNEFRTDGPAGEEVAYKLLFGTDEKAIEKYRRENGGRWGIGDSLRRKLTRVGGMTDRKLAEWIGELDAQDARNLARKLEAADGGIETEIEIVCSKCQWQQWVNLPFGADFFVPNKRREAAKAAKKSSETEPEATTAGGTMTTMPSVGHEGEPLERTPTPHPTHAASHSQARRTG